MDYLRWAKVHDRAKYELTISGVPHASWEDLGVDPPVELEVRGSYGDPRLIELIAERYRVPTECVVPVPGASSANFIAFAATARHGDRVVLEHPIYQPMQRVAEFLNLDIQWLRRRPENCFAIDHDELESHLKRGARAVMLTNLHNPSGQYIPPAEMKRIADLCALHGAKLVVDEVYLDSVYLNGGGSAPEFEVPRGGTGFEPGADTSLCGTGFQPITQSPGLWSAACFGPHVIGLNSLTKVYGLSGLRLGWILAGWHSPASPDVGADLRPRKDQQGQCRDAEQSRDRAGKAGHPHPERLTQEPATASQSSSPLAERAREIMDFLSANNAAPSMSLAIRAFERIHHLEERFRRFYRESQPVFRDWLRSQPRVHGYPNYGALFECLRLPPGVHADRLHELLVSEYDTQVVPGAFFDLPDHIRLTPAAATNLAEALNRLTACVAQLSNR